MTNLNDKTISAAGLAARLPDVLADVRRGSTYLVMDGDESIAMISPPRGLGGSGVAREAHAHYDGHSSPAEPPLSDSALSRLIGSRASRAVLGVFVRDPAATLHQREIARQAGLGLRSAQIALEKLVATGLLSAQRDGNRLYYRASRSTRFEELRSLLSREMGVAGVIARYLAESPAPVERAFIFGSLAEGIDTVSSDIDLLVVADTAADDLVGPIADAQRELGREIDLVHYRPDDFRSRIQEGNHFLSALLMKKRIDVIGGPDDA